MSTFNLNVEDCNKNQFPIDLILIGNQIYNGIVSLGRYTAGIIVLVPLGIASIVIIPITYIILTVIFTFYLIRIHYSTLRILQITVNKENYKTLYNLFLFSNKTISNLTKIRSVNRGSKKSLLIRPILFFINKIYSEVTKVNQHLEEQLFEKQDPESLSDSDVEFFRNQLNTIDHDWNDGELWMNFQTEHHHLAN